MKVLKWLLLTVVLAQIPFAWSLYRTRQAVAYLSSTRPWNVISVPFLDVPGCVHVHSQQGGHSLGTYPQIIEAAKGAGLRYVFITEHPRRPPVLAQIEDADVTLIYGVEVEAEGGLRVLEGPTGSVRFLSHFEGGVIPAGYDGIEIYSLHDNASAEDSWFERANFLYHQFYHPELFFLHLWRIDEKTIALWDRAQALRPVAGIAGNDAHQNVGLRVETTAGQTLFSVMVDPYLFSFQFVSTHALLPVGREPSPEAILGALASGSAYVAFDRLGDPLGFSFHAIGNQGVVAMGSRAPLGADLVFQAPTPVRFRLLKSGSLFRELEGVRFTLEKAEAGIYRVEVYPLNPPPLLAGKPWILSNPIRVGP